MHDRSTWTTASVGSWMVGWRRPGPGRRRRRTAAVLPSVPLCLLLALELHQTGDGDGVGVRVDPGTASPSHRRPARRSLQGMEIRNEIREFLAFRRARITPQQAGLPAYGGHRRVPGLRREEVGPPAGVSVDYYTQMERGNLGGVSDSVLHSLAGALQLDEAERSHLFDLAGTATTSARPRRPTGPQRVRPSIQRLLDAMTGVPAYVRTGRLDILAVNRLGHALYAPVLANQGLPVNLARFLFLDPGAGDFYVDWDKTANDA